MKIKDTPNKNDIIFPDDTEQSFPDEQANMHFKEETTRDMDIVDLDFQLSELEELPNTPFNRKKRKEIEAHRRELIKAQRAEERERIKLDRAKRKEEKKQAEWKKKSVEAETATKIAEEHQRESLARDRRRRARRRKVDRIFDLIGKLIFTIILIIGVLCISNQSVRDRVAITFNNLFELVGNWADGDTTSSNKTVDELLRPLGEDLNKSDKDSNKQSKTEKKTEKKDTKKSTKK